MNRYGFPEPDASRSEAIAVAGAPRGGNLVDVTLPSGEAGMCRLPTKFRKLILVNRGTFLIVGRAQHDFTTARGAKGQVRFEAVHILHRLAERGYGWAMLEVQRLGFMDGGGVAAWRTAEPMLDEHPDVAELWAACRTGAASGVAVQRVLFAQVQEPVWAEGDTPTSPQEHLPGASRGEERPAAHGKVPGYSADAEAEWCRLNPCEKGPGCERNKWGKRVPEESEECEEYPTCTWCSCGWCPWGHHVLIKKRYQW